MQGQIQGDPDTRVTLVYPTGETEHFIIEEVFFDQDADGEFCTMTLIPIEETDDEPQGDSRAVPEGQ